MKGKTNLLASEASIAARCRILFTDSCTPADMSGTLP